MNIFLSRKYLANYSPNARRDARTSMSSCKVVIQIFQSNA